MIRFLRLAFLALLALVAVLTVAAVALQPAPGEPTSDPSWPTAAFTVRGAYHVHSVNSDGTGTLDDIAAAAARAGLQFVIVTDHGDGTRETEAPRYRSGVLVIDGVEVNTTAGHLVGLGARTSPYPLAGTPESVLEDLHRLGGIGIAAHPGSPRASLQWKDWTTPVDGLEWLNADSEWRDELVESLGRLLLTYALRPAETLTSALDRPATVIQRWDALTSTRRVVGLAGADAHARLGFRQQTDPYEEGLHMPVPSYEASFRTFSLRVLLDTGLSGDPARDAADIIDRIRWGRVYTVVDGLAAPGGLEFTATSGAASVRMGDYLDPSGEVRLHARMAAPSGSRMVILQNGTTLFDTREAETHLGVADTPAVYRIEVHAPNATGQPPVPWLVSNPIYVGMRPIHAQGQAAVPAFAESDRLGVATGAWVAEASPGSTSVLDAKGVIDGLEGLTWRFQTAGGTPSGQYAAVRFPVNGLRGIARFQLHARAERPVRIWVQVRASSLGAGQRWGQTIYLDPSFRTVDVPVAGLPPIGETASPAPPLDAIDVMLLVVDTVNTRPGTSGAVQVQSLWLIPSSATAAPPATR